MVKVYRGYSVMHGEKTNYFICPDPPCKYEEVVLYYQEKANLYCEPFQDIFMGKNFYDEEDI